MPTEKTDDLPDFKDQCRRCGVPRDPPARRTVARDLPARGIVASARHSAPSSPPRQLAGNQDAPGIKDQAQSFFGPLNAEEPTVVETMTAEAVHMPVTVETMIAEAIPLCDEESKKQVTPLPQETTVS
jgi:hypothetical protein